MKSMPTTRPMAIPRAASSRRTMRNRLVIVFSVAVGLLAPVPVIAHHTGSTLLSETTVTLKGVVKTWLWSNPHCLLTLEVKGADGQVVQWVVEAQAPNSIYPAGLSKELFQSRRPGDRHGEPGYEWPSVRSYSERRARRWYEARRRRSRPRRGGTVKGYGARLPCELHERGRVSLACRRPGARCSIIPPTQMFLFERVPA